MRHWLEAFPEAPVPHRWFVAGSALVACVVLGASGLLFSSATDDVTAVVLRVGVLITAACTLISPLPSAVAFAVLLQIAATHPELQSPVVFFGTLGVVGALALCLRPSISALNALLLWYFALSRVISGEFIPDDLEASAVLGAFIVIVWAGGLVIRETLITRQRESAQFQQQIEDERDRAVKALHGSVAASLTSVVLRSESMAMNATDKTRDESLLIAEDARRAMREVRELIRFMRTDDASEFDVHEHQGPPEVLNHVVTIIGKIRSHGFTVIDSGIKETVLSDVRMQNAYTVFRELKTNILKYADPNKPVIIAAVREEETLTLALQNSIAEGTRDVSMTTEIGLEEAIKLVKRDGGSLTFTQSDSTWRSELTFPLPSLSKEKERK